MSSHARLSPSDKAWPRCPGSVREQANYPDIAGAAAISGTGTHLLIETALLDGNWDLSVYKDQVLGVGHEDQPTGWVIDQERIDRAQQCMDYVANRYHALLAEFPGATISIEAESRADPGGMFGRTDWYGTCDVTLTVALLQKTLFIEVIDYKDGREWVDAHHNTQLLSYWGGKARAYVATGPQKIRPLNAHMLENGCRLTIVQPRTSPAVRYCDLSTQEALEELESLAWAAHLTDAEDAPLVPDDEQGKGHCRWCKHREKCPALAAVKTEQVAAASVTVDLMTAAADPANVSGADLATLLDQQKLIEEAFAKLNAEALQRAKEGIAIENDSHRYVIGQGNRSYSWDLGEEETIKMLKNRKLREADYYVRKLISPAQMRALEKLTEDQKNRIWSEFVRENPGKPKLVKLDRPAATMLFAGIEE